MTVFPWSFSEKCFVSSSKFIVSAAFILRNTMENVVIYKGKQVQVGNGQEAW